MLKDEKEYPTKGKEVLAFVEHIEKEIQNLKELVREYNEQFAR